MIPMHVKVDLEGFGASLAHRDSHEIAKLLTGLCNELLKICEAHYYAEMQMHYICFDLSPEHQELLACLGPIKEGK